MAAAVWRGGGHRPLERDPGRGWGQQTYILMLGKQIRLTADLFSKPFPLVFSQSDAEQIVLEVFNESIHISNNSPGAKNAKGAFNMIRCRQI